jgi:hypothetical protein
MLELPFDFIHQPPIGYRYETLQHKTNIVAIWTVCNPGFDYNHGADIRCIWGFCKSKISKKGGCQNTYYAPINSNKVGKEVDINDTRPLTAMQIHYVGLEQFFVRDV